MGDIGAPLHVATDCSGLGTPLLALRRMGVRARHLWASDPDKGARRMLRLHCPPDRLYRHIGTGVRRILECLRELDLYNIYYRQLNTREHGVPQNRPRCFFVGIRREYDRGTFRFPQPVPMPDIRTFLDPRGRRPSFADLPPETATTARSNVLQTLRQIESQNRDPFWEPWVIECDASAQFTKAMFGISPCLTRSRFRGHWVTSLGRRINRAEALRLQGFESDFKCPLSEAQLRMLLGNATSMNVLERLFCSLLPAAGLTAALPGPYIDA